MLGCSSRSVSRFVIVGQVSCWIDYNAKCRMCHQRSVVKFTLCESPSNPDAYLLHSDLWDKDFDRHVERTKDRPLARGDISVPQALTFLGLLLSGGLGVLVTLNVESVVVGMMSMPLVVCYPLMKRYTNWPQLFLGLTFNWGALVGYTAASSPEASLLSLLVDASSLQPSFSGAVLTTMSSGSIAHAVPLYCAGVCWTLVYDTLYGYQDRKDDARIG